VRLDGWDEGKIHRFMNQPRTQGYAVDLMGGGILVIYTDKHSVIASVAKTVDAILTLLGTPRGFTVYLWWRDDPRILEADAWPTRTEVNGGWASPGKPAVHVYRKEEYVRVILHEAIHAMEFDWTMPSTPLLCWGLGEDANVSPHLAEAWTELYAEWLYCGWYNISWETQKQWQEHQAIQILARQGSRTWSENSNIFAYYVLKAALAPHISFLWTFRNGQTKEEEKRVLCSLVTPKLSSMREQAKRIKPKKISMCMTVIKN
jgi:hypothetical protein